MHKEKISIPEGLKGQFRNVVNTRCGLYFKDYDLKDLEQAVGVRMQACNIDSPAAYYNLLIFSEKREDEFRELLNLLTIKHTYFFRNEPQFKALKERILPDIMERRLRQAGEREAAPKGNTIQKPVIRIWSAGCSTGEEPYTIAMVLKDTIPDPEAWDVQIVATDASTEALENARKGVYGVNSMKLVDQEHKDRYFIERKHSGIDARYELKDEIKKMVHFSFFNLMEEDYPAGFDIIFCRNVVIYFELETTIRVMNKFAKSLNEDGYLFIGYSESLQFISDHFRMIDWEDAIFYAKVKEGREAPRFRPFGPAEREPVRVEISVEQFEKAVEELSRAEVAADTHKEAERHKSSKRLKELLIEAVKAFHLKQYEEAIALAEEARKVDQDAVEPYYLVAEISANQGRPELAKENLRMALGKDMMFAPAHYLMGSLHIQENSHEEAKNSLKKAIYLDHGFSLAHFGLANIYRDSGNIASALREYRNTLNILSKASLYDIVPYSGGFNTVTLASVCKSNIERLKSA